MASFCVCRFHIFVECPHCAQKMHVDPAALSSPTRTIMCENPECVEYGWAWTLDILTGEGTSERKTLEEQFPQLSQPPDPELAITELVAGRPLKRRRLK